MLASELLHDEVTFLYEVASKIARAATPDEQLEAISDYPRSRGAQQGILFYLEFEGNVRIDEVVAEWTIDTPAYGLGTKIRVTPDQTSTFWHGQPTEAILIEDAYHDTRIGSVGRDIFKNHQIRSIVILPLFRGDRWVAFVIFGWRTPQKFHQLEQRVYTLLLQQTTPVIESMRLLDQAKRRALEMESAQHEIDVLYRASHLLVQSSSPHEILDAVSGYARERGAVTGFLGYCDDFKLEWLEVVAFWSNVQGYNIMGQRSDLNMPDRQRRIFESPDRPVFIEDIRNSDYVERDGIERAIKHHIQSIVVMPLYTNERWVGNITFHWDQPYKFSDRDRRIFTSLQHHTALAIDSIRVFEQVRNRTQELEEAVAEVELLYRAGEAINAALSYTDLVDAVSIVNIRGTSVALYFWENWDFERADYIEIVAATGHLRDKVGHRNHKNELSYTEDYQQERIFILENVMADARLADASKGSYLRHDMQAAISVRLFVKSRWIGALIFHSRWPRTFTERERRLAQGVGEYVRGAVERIRLNDETEAARLRAEAFADKAHQLAVLEERTRLARELHDSVSQALYGIALGARTARTLFDRDPQRAVEAMDYVLSLSEAGLAEMRALIFELRPETLEKEGLIEALTKQVTMLRARHNLQLHTSFCLEPELPIQHKEAIYWIAREALHNIVKHASATDVHLGCECVIGAFMLTITDNGSGFDLQDDFSGHFGLKSMAERAEKIGGELYISSSTDGTEIRFRLPYVPHSNG